MAAAGLWATSGIAAASLALYAGLIVDYRLGIGDWIALAVVLTICVGYVLGTSALLRRPGVALPGLLGGVFVTVVGLGLSGPMTMPDPAPRRRRAVRLTLLILAIAALTVLAASLQLNGR